MERPWKRIIPPTEDSDSWSSDNDIDNNQWISINKRARLSAQANMRGENQSRDAMSDAENVQNSLENVLLHHDYAERSERRIATPFWPRPSSTLSPILSDDVNNDSSNRNIRMFRYQFENPVRQLQIPPPPPSNDLERFDSAISVLQSINYNTPSTSFNNDIRTAPVREATPTPRDYIDQATSTAEPSVATAPPMAASTFVPPTSSSHSFQFSHSRHKDLQRKLHFLIAMSRCSREATLAAIPEAERAEAVDSSLPIDCRIESIFSLLPSASTPENNTQNILNNISPTDPCNSNNAAINISTDIAPNLETPATEPGLEIIQEPPVERLESIEAVDSISTVTVSTSDIVNGSNVSAAEVQATDKTLQNQSATNSISSNLQSDQNDTNRTSDSTEVVSYDAASPANDPITIESTENSVHFLNQGLLSLLECPVCWEYITPPIHQCKRGHLVCLPCMQRLHSCPTCRSRFTNLRNLSMEKVADKLHYPCKNTHSGCNETMRLVEKPEHEANCMHRIYRCIVSVCPWHGKHPDLLNHMTREHHEIVVYGDHKHLYISLDTHATSENWILLAHGVIFRVNFVVNSSQGKIHGCVQYVGPRKQANNYSYTFRAENPTGDTKRSFEYSRTTHNDQGKLSAIYNAGDAFMMMRNTASFFSTSTERHMLVRVSITQINNVEV